MKHKKESRALLDMLPLVYVIAFAAVGFIVILLMMGLRTGYSWREMDWENKGYTTLFNVVQASDIGKRKSGYHGMVCDEYFSYNETAVVKEVCGNQVYVLHKFNGAVF